MSTPLDHYLTHGQQVVFQSLELQEVPISPQKLSSRSYQQNLGSHLSKADHRVRNKQRKKFFVFPGLTYMTTNQEYLSLPGLLET